MQKRAGREKGPPESVLTFPSKFAEFDPSFQEFGVSEALSQSPLTAPERLSGPRGGSAVVSERCVRFQRREKKVGHSEAPKRSRFLGCPLKGAPTLGLQPSGSYPRATDKGQAQQSLSEAMTHKAREFCEQFEGSPPGKTRVVRQVTPESVNGRGRFGDMLLEVTQSPGSLFSQRRH